MNPMSAWRVPDTCLASSPLCVSSSAAKATGPRLQPKLAGRALAAVCALVLLLSAFSIPAGAQSVSFAGLETTVANGGSGNPTFAAVDGAGDVFIVDHGSYQVIEVAPNGVQTTVPTSGLNNPNGIALDQAGDVFVADVVNNRVVEVPYLGNGTYGSQTTVPATLNRPEGVGLDTAGDLFIADTGNQRVVELPYLGGGNYGTQINLPFSGLADPFGVALDAAGDVFVAEFGATSILEFPYLGGGNYGAQVAIGSGMGGKPIGGPEGVAVDANGNVFAADTNNNQVVEVPYVGNGNYGAQFTVGSGLKEPTGVAVDGKGGVFIVDNGNDRTLEVQRIAANFGSVNVGSNSSLTLTYNINSSVVLAATPAVVTQGAPNLDFTLSGTPTCTGAQTAPATCSVTVQFAPLAPGLRQGAVQLYDSSNNLLVTTLLRGVGEAPQLVFPGGPEITVNNGYYPPGVATDAAGNVYMSGYPGAGEYGYVIVIAPGCTSSSCYKQWGSGWIGPGELAVDGVGNIYVPSFYGPIDTYIVPPECTSSSCETTVGSGIGAPDVVALDGAGDIYIGDEYYGHPLYEVRVVGGQTTVGSGVLDPEGLALDDLGDVFVTSFSQGTTVEVPSVGLQSNFAPWLGGASALAADAAGDVYIANNTGSSVTEVPAGCTSSACDIALPGGYGFVGGLALNSAGDLYIADENNGPLYEVQRSQAPTLSFPSTTVGVTSSALTVAIQNIGNQPLTFASLAASTNFTVDSGSTTCSTSSPLAVGATCNVGVDFAPTTTGPLTGTLTVTDNSLNASAATRTVNLQGTAAAATYQLTTAANPANGGTVTPPSGPFTANSVVNLTATANAGYVFTGWTGNVANASSAATTVTMSGPQAVTANFVPSQLHISRSTLDFGTVYLNNAYHELPFTITNVSTSTITISGVTIVPGTADGAAYQLSDHCKGQIKPRQVCSVSVDFLADAVGTLTATLNIADSAAGSPQQVSLTANVIDPVATLSPKPLMFGRQAVNSQTTLPVQLSNSGQTDLTVGNIAIGGPEADDYSQSNDCPSTLTPTASCTIEITFTPSAKGGRDARLTVSGNMPTGNTVMGMSGIGH
ncbi:MAG: choice-of-anchor D domain-containing protein [Terriglobales bacterium]